MKALLLLAVVILAASVSGRSTGTSITTTAAPPAGQAERNAERSVVQEGHALPGLLLQQWQESAPKWLNNISAAGTATSKAQPEAVAPAVTSTVQALNKVLERINDNMTDFYTAQNKNITRLVEQYSTLINSACNASGEQPDTISTTTDALPAAEAESAAGESEGDVESKSNITTTGALPAAEAENAAYESEGDVESKSNIATTGALPAAEAENAADDCDCDDQSIINTITIAALPAAEAENAAYESEDDDQWNTSSTSTDTIPAAEAENAAYESEDDDQWNTSTTTTAAPAAAQAENNAEQRAWDCLDEDAIHELRKQAQQQLSYMTAGLSAVQASARAVFEQEFRSLAQEAAKHAENAQAGDQARVAATNVGVAMLQALVQRQNDATTMLTTEHFQRVQNFVQDAETLLIQRVVAAKSKPSGK